MAIQYRLGSHRDVSSIADFLHRSAGGISDFLLQDIDHEGDVNEFIELGVADESTNIFYKNTLVADDGEAIQGMINFYPAARHVLPDIMYSFIGAERVKVIEPIFTNLPENSVYIYSLACNEGYSKANVAAGLMFRAVRFARQNGFKSLCMHVWPNNHKFREFLLQAGARVIRKIPMEPMPFFDYQEQIHLLSFDVTSRTKNDI